MPAFVADLALPDYRLDFDPHTHAHRRRGPSPADAVYVRCSHGDSPAQHRQSVLNQLAAVLEAIEDRAVTKFIECNISLNKAEMCQERKAAGGLVAGADTAAQVGESHVEQYHIFEQLGHQSKWHYGEVEELRKLIEKKGAPKARKGRVWTWQALAVELRAAAKARGLTWAVLHKEQQLRGMVARLDGGEAAWDRGARLKKERAAQMEAQMEMDKDEKME